MEEPNRPIRHSANWGIPFMRVLLPVLMIVVAGALQPSISAAQSSTPTRIKTKLPGGFFLPHGNATKIVTVSRGGAAKSSITVMTEAVAVKEAGPAATVRKFGEAYAFSPAFIAMRRDEPTALEFWNLQPDDEHDLALLGSDGKVLMYVMLAPLTKTTYVFDFHQTGIFTFKCLRHQPEMSGQFLIMNR
ncbi:MAG: hypothetical protein ACREQX_00955 [Candidatus Binataceae bacterium]